MVTLRGGMFTIHRSTVGYKVYMGKIRYQLQVRHYLQTTLQEHTHTSQYLPHTHQIEKGTEW